MITRSQNEIAEWERHFESQIWYSRHMLRSAAIEAGRLSLVHDDDPTSAGSAKTISNNVWLRACEAAIAIEAELKGDTGPWTDYEWGKINGKLSALRWAMGLPWDMLDT